MFLDFNQILMRPASSHDLQLLPHETEATTPQPVPFLGNENTQKIKGKIY